MRFQSNTSYSTLSPDEVADAYGPITSVSVSIAGPSSAALVARPPTGYENQLYTLSAYAATTTSSTAVFRITDENGMVIVCAFQAATGTVLNWSGYLPMNRGLLFTNATNVTAAAFAHYRQVPLPT